MFIKILNEINFIRLMIKNDINANTVEGVEDTYIISINYPYGDKTGYFKKDYNNVLRLFFDDVDYDEEIYDEEINQVRELIAFRPSDAKKVLTFLEKIKKNLNDNTKLIIHCKAGISRSGAVGIYANDFFRLKYDDFMKENPMVRPNSCVLRTLNRLTYYE